MKRSVPSLVCLLLASLVFAEEARSRFSRPIDFPQAEDGQTLVSVPFDGAVYGEAAQGFSDVRVYDGSGAETPFLIRKDVQAKSRTVARPIKSDIRSFAHDGERRVEIVVAREGEESDVDGIRIKTPLKNFEYAVSVYGSPDGAAWKPLVDDGRIYDYSRFMDVREDEVSLPSNGYRFFKIVCAEAVQERPGDRTVVTRTSVDGVETSRNERIEEESRALRIDGIELFRNVVETVPDSEATAETPIGNIEVRQDGKNKATVIEIPGAKRPFKAFVLKTDSRNFKRSAELSAQDGNGIEGSWTPLGVFDIASLAYKDILSERTAVEFPERRADRYRLTVRNDDNPPLKITGIVGVGPRHQALFLADRGTRYELRYGDPAAKAPKYDVAIVEELVSRGITPTEAALGSERRIRDGGTGFRVRRVLDSVWFLGAVVVLMAAALAWSLVRATKKAKGLSD